MKGKRQPRLDSTKSNSNLRELKKLKGEYQTARDGYRSKKREILAKAMGIVVELRKDKLAAESFYKIVTKDSKKKGKINLTAAVVVYVTNARSLNTKKLAWKAARVLDYLYDIHGISPRRIADQIQKWGGIESLAKEASKKKPLRANKKAAISISEKNAIKRLAGKTIKNSIDDDDWSVEPDQGRSDKKYTHVTVRLERESLSNLLMARPSRVKLICKLLESDDAFAVVHKMILLK